MAAATLSASSLAAAKLGAAAPASGHASVPAPSRRPLVQKSAFFGNKAAALSNSGSATSGAATPTAVVQASCQPGAWQRAAARQRGAAAARDLWWAARQGRCAPGGSQARRAYPNPWAGAFDPAVVMNPWAFGTMPRGGAWGGQMGIPQMLQEVFRSVRAASGWDVEETDSAWVLRIDLPGFGPEDVRVQVVDDKVLQISAKDRRQQQEEQQGGASQQAFRSRRAVGFEVRVPLPNAVAADNVAAELKRGVLRVTLPKVEKEVTKRRVVDVAVGSDGDATSASSASEGAVKQAPEATPESGTSEGSSYKPQLGGDEGQIRA